MIPPTFATQVGLAQVRAAALRRKAQKTGGEKAAALLEEALEELSTAFEERSVAQEELRVQNEAPAAAEAGAVAERDPYKDLFEFAPVGGRGVFRPGERCRLTSARRAALARANRCTAVTVRSVGAAQSVRRGARRRRVRRRFFVRPGDLGVRAGVFRRLADPFGNPPADFACPVEELLAVGDGV